MCLHAQMFLHQRVTWPHSWHNQTYTKYPQQAQSLQHHDNLIGCCQGKLKSLKIKANNVFEELFIANQSEVNETYLFKWSNTGCHWMAHKMLSLLLTSVIVTHTTLMEYNVQKRWCLVAIIHFGYFRHNKKIRWLFETFINFKNKYFYKKQKWIQLIFSKSFNFSTNILDFLY